jgi:hypothetical protein
MRVPINTGLPEIIIAEVLSLAFGPRAPDTL